MHIVVATGQDFNAVRVHRRRYRNQSGTILLRDIPQGELALQITCVAAKCKLLLFLVLFAANCVMSSASGAHRSIALFDLKADKVLDTIIADPDA